MAINIFGFQFKRNVPTKEQNVSFATPQYDDGAVNVAAGGAYGTYVDMEGSARTEAELVTKYRELAQHPEVDAAISDIVDEAIVCDDNQLPVELNLESIQVTPKIKQILKQEFDGVLRLLEFDTHSYEVFKRWYVDGRLFYHVIVNDERQNRCQRTTLYRS